MAPIAQTAGHPAMTLVMDRRNADPDALMARLAEGDRSALGPLYEALWPRRLALAAKILDDPSTAEDAAQQGLLKLVAEAHRYDTERSVAPWALTLVAWECRTLKRRQGRRKEVALDPILSREAGGASPEDEAIRSALVESAQQALASLSPLDRETLELAFADVAPGERPVSNPTFRKRRQRALSRLREAWRSLYER